MITKSTSTNVIFSILLSHFALFAQPQVDIEKYRPKRIIDRIEILGGPSVFFPDDHGYAELIDKLSLGTLSYGISKKWGYCYGIAVSHSLGKRFEISLRVMNERKGYFEGYNTYDGNGDLYGISNSETLNNYLTYSLIPTYFFSNKKRFNFSMGVSTYVINKSTQKPTLHFLNGLYLPLGGSANTIDAYYKYEWGAVSGIGYVYPITKKIYLSGNCQFFYGLTNMIHENQYTLSGKNLLCLVSIKYSLQ